MPRGAVARSEWLESLATAGFQGIGAARVCQNCAKHQPLKMIKSVQILSA
jgi:hypothetical protein